MSKNDRTMGQGGLLDKLAGENEGDLSNSIPVGWVCPTCESSEFQYVIKGYVRVVPLEVVAPSDGGKVTTARILYDEGQYDAEDGDDEDYLYIRCTGCLEEWNLSDWYGHITKAGDRIVISTDEDEVIESE